MADWDNDRVFTGAVAEIYDDLLVPLIFQPFADDLAERASSVQSGRLLEVAAGTGVVTRALASRLAPTVEIVATDLNPGMIERAEKVGTSRPVTWGQADVMHLPYEAAEFDVAVCQFGIMFFPDRVAALREVRRVLRPGGRLLFSTWERIEDNEFADVATEALVPLFPDDPPRFLARTPHGYHDRPTIESDVRAAGFTLRRFDRLEAVSCASTARAAAAAYCQGSPLRDEIVARGPERLDEATAAATAAIAARFGSDQPSGRIAAWIVDAEA